MKGATMRKFIRKIFTSLGKKKDESVPVDTGCIHCNQFDGKGCRLTGIIFPDYFNVSIKPKSCPVAIIYWDLFDMKKRELDEFAEVCAKETEQKKDIEPITRRCANCDHSERGDSLWYCFETGRFMSPNGWCESWGGEKNATK